MLKTYRVIWRQTIWRHIANKGKKEKELENILSEIEEVNDNAKMYKVIRLLSRKPFENPFINDEEGKRITNPQDIYEAIREHFKHHFNDPTESEIEPFIGMPKKLNKPFTQDEIRYNIKKLSNNKQSTWFWQHSLWTNQIWDRRTSTNYKWYP